MLCEEIREAVSIEDFMASNGGAVSSAIPFSGVALEGTEKLPSLKTLEADVVDTWLDITARRYGTPISSGQFVDPSVPIETWRIHLLREAGSWKLCDFDQLPD